MPARGNRRLGRLPPRHDLRTIHFGDLLDRKLLPAPLPAVDWNAGLPADLGMMRNSDLGDCGFAAQGHAVQTWTTRHLGKTITPTDDEVVAAYSGCTGYKPGDSSTDQGVVLSSALKYWRSTGIGTHKIGAYAKVNHHNLDHVKIAIDLCGGLYIGVDLPIRAQAQKVWTGPTGGFGGDDAPGSWGGHAVQGVGHDHAGMTVVTWGARQRLDWQWWLDYSSEAWACISVDWVDGTKPAPNGFDIARLQGLLAAL